MKKLIAIFVFTAFVVSCGNDGPKEVKLVDGEKVVISFANGTPQIVREVKTVNNKTEGIYEKEYYDDGNLLKEGPLENNQRHGLWKTYYRNGNIWNEGSYMKGVRQDTIKSYYTNGNLKYIGLYDQGQKTGTWLFYDESGTLTENQVYMKPGEIREADIYLPSDSK